MALLADLRGLQPRLHAAAHARPPRDAAPHLHVPPRRAVGGLQPHLLHWIRDHGDRDADLPRDRLADAGAAQGPPHRELVPSALAASALFTAAAAVRGPIPHTALAAAALASLLVISVQALRGSDVAPAPWRDYVTLTKPRIMLLLLVTGFCGMI